jgi:hypothetical protein
MWRIHFIFFPIVVGVTKRRGSCLLVNLEAKFGVFKPFDYPKMSNTMRSVGVKFQKKILPPIRYITRCYLSA